MMHGVARLALRISERRQDPRSVWASRLRLHRSNIAVALANKNAQVIYRAAPACLPSACGATLESTRVEPRPGVGAEKVPVDHQCCASC